jgi:hypothetical protein
MEKVERPSLLDDQEGDSVKAKSTRRSSRTRSTNVGNDRSRLSATAKKS